MPQEKTKHNHSLGFTLVELSIVLIIIGLLVGGILLGRDLIISSEVRAQIAQIQTYNQAVNTFRDKYGGIPGDLVVADATRFGFPVPVTCTGQQGGRDGNGLLDAYTGTQIYAALMGEPFLFWQDLTTANLANNPVPVVPYATLQWTCSATIANTPSGYLPEGKIGYGTYVHVYEVNSRNWFVLSNITSFSTSKTLANSTIPVSLAYNIDLKIDDGIPTTGNVNTTYINNSQSNTSQSSNAAADSPTTCYRTGGGDAYSFTYNNGSGRNCALSFRFQ